MSFVYFIECQHDASPIKIGYTLRLDKRVADLQCGCPWPLKLMYAFDAGEYGYEIEHAFHLYFSDLRQAGSEWFTNHIDIHVFVGRLEAFSAETKARPSDHVTLSCRRESGHAIELDVRRQVPITTVNVTVPLKEIVR